MASCPALDVGAEECPFYGQPSVPGHGCEKPDWIAVGEGPGHTEVREGEPFVGASGGMLNRALRQNGVDRATLWITNATLCLPKPNATDTAREKAAELCAFRLQHELERFPGRPVLALGAIAARTLIGRDFSITQMAGSAHTVGDRIIVPTVHPAAILRGGAGGGAHSPDLLFYGLLYDVSKVKRVAAGTSVLFSDDVEIEIESKARAERMLRDMLDEARTAGLVAIDVETVGEGKHSAKEAFFATVTQIGIATEDRAISVDWNLITGDAMKWLRTLLGDPGIAKLFHNRLYDQPVLERAGFTIRGEIHDTMLGHHAAFPGCPHDLQRVGSQWFLIPPWKAEFREGSGEPAELAKYNARDALVTARVWSPIRRCLSKIPGAERVYEVDSIMAGYAAQLHRVGIPISREVNSRMSIEFLSRIKEARDEINEIAHNPELTKKFLRCLAIEQARRPRKADPPGYEDRVEVRQLEAEAAWEKGKLRFKVGSADHVAAYCRAVGRPILHVTQTGRTSTSREVLDRLTTLPLIAARIKHEEARKIYSTFVRRIPFFLDEHARLHPMWKVVTIVGRWACDNPQMMNWPKADAKKDRPNTRAQVVAPEGRVLIGADYAQLHARLIAMMSGDPFLCDIFANDRDIHTEFARLVFPAFDTLPKEERKILRDMIKRPEYAKLYGSSVETMYDALKVDYPQIKLADVAKMSQLIDSKMVGVIAWHGELVKQCALRGYLESAIHGRRRNFPLGNASINDVYNFPVLSTEADLVGLGLMRLLPALPPGAELIMHQHDAVYLECDEDQAEEVRDIVTRELSCEHTLNGITVKFPAEAEIAKSWDLL